MSAALENALRRVETEDAELFSTHERNERALTHRLAVYLERDPTFDGWSVDCEYGRWGDRPKRMHAQEGDRIQIPDIIIHNRGRSGPSNNLLAIEAKRTCTGQEELEDRAKLRFYRAEIGYRFTAFVHFRSAGQSTVSVDSYDAEP